MDSPREPLPPIVDERLIEAPFEVSVLGRTYVEPEVFEHIDSAVTSRQAKRAQRIALKEARREAKAQSKINLTAELQSDTDIQATTDTVNSVDVSSLIDAEAEDDELEPVQPTSVIAEPPPPVDAVKSSGRNVSFDELIDGPST